MKKRTHPRLRSLAFVLALIASTAGVYLQALDHDYVSYDDAKEVFENSRLQEPLTPASVVRPFTEPFFFNWVPLTDISFHVDHALYGNTPGGFLLTNVVLHTASVVLLFLVLQSLTGAPGPSAFVAAVFALHPLHVESVAWISERKDVLSGFFWMLTLFFYARYTARPGVLRMLWVVLGFALGLLSKPMVVTLPFALLLLDYWPLRRLDTGRRRAGAQPVPVARLLGEKLPLIALAALSSVITYRVQSAAGALSGHSIAWGWRIQNALEAYGTYLLQTAWPAGLAVIYPLPVERPGWGVALLSTVVLAGFCGLAIGQRHARPFLTCGWFWFLGTLVPVIGIVPVGLQAHADRYMYLPMIGLSIALAWEARDLALRGRISPLLTSGIAVATLVVLGLTAHRQVGHWTDSRALFEHAIAVVERNYVAHDGLASHLLEHGFVDEAERHYREAARLNPHWFSPEQGLGNLFLERGQPERSIPHFERAIQLAPDNPFLHANLAKAWTSMGRPKLALPHLDRALELERGFGRPRMLALRGEALASLGQRSGAIEQYGSALDLDPNLASAHANRGVLLARSGHGAEAVRDIEQAFELGLESSLLHSIYADLLVSMNEPEAAASHYRRALQIEPGLAATANNLSWLLATTGDARVRDPAEAIRIAEALVGAVDEKDRVDPTLLDTLATAYAADGRYDDALRTAKRAATEAKAMGNLALRDEIRQRSLLYRREHRPREAQRKSPGQATHGDAVHLHSDAP